MELRRINTSQQGTVGLNAAMFYYTLNGYNCSISPGDASEIDLIIEKDGILESIQVKTATSLSIKEQSFNVPLLSTDKRTKNVVTYKSIQNVKFDRLFILTAAFDIYEFKKSEITVKNAMVLPSEQYKNNFKLRLLKSDYLEHDEVLKLSKQKYKEAFDKRERKVLKLTITKEELQKLLEDNNYNFYSLGKILNVSDNAVRKRAKKFGLIYKSREFRKKTK